MIFLDIETQNDWTINPVISIPEYKISYTGVIDDKDKAYDFWEDDMEKLGELLKSADMIVGYNIFGFDMPIITNYLGPDILKLPQLDLMAAAFKALGFRPKLDSLTTATFGESKIGKGSDAVKYFAAGDLDSLKKYCLEDVRLTKKLYEFGKENGYVKYFDRKGFISQIDINWDDGLKERKESKEDTGVISMF